MTEKVDATVMKCALNSPDSRVSIGIIGGGAAGTLLAIYLLRNARVALDIRIYEPAGELGGGLAYSTREPGHLMNGPVTAYSLYPDDDAHFTRWFLQHAQKYWGLDLRATDARALYAPRHVYADYLRAELAHAQQRAPQHSLRHVRAQVVALYPEVSHSTLLLDNGARESVQHVVLATGIFKQRPAFVAESMLGECYAADPWRPPTHFLAPQVRDIAIIGSGLTMIDAVLDLERRHYRGRYHVFSRHGFIPAARDDLAAPATPPRAMRSDASVRELFRAYRQSLRAEIAVGGNWQTLSAAFALDGCQRWTTLPERERRRFLRHVLPYWNLLVHRAPPASQQAIERLRAEGRLQLHAGRVSAVTLGEERQIELRVRERGASTDTYFTADRVINCSGLGYRWSMERSEPLVRQLLSDGIVQADPLGMGIALDTRQRVLDRQALPWPDVYALGAPARGLLLESSSLRFLMAQAQALASTLLSQQVASAES